MIDDVFSMHFGPTGRGTLYDYEENHTSLTAALLSAVINSKNIVYLLYVLALWREQPPAPLLCVTKNSMHKPIHMYLCTYVCHYI